MKIRAIALLSILPLVGCEQLSQTTNNEVDVDLSNSEQKAAYSLGANAAHYLATNLPQIQEIGYSLDINVVKQGFNDRLNGKTMLEQEEIRDTLMAFQSELQTKLQEKQAASAKVNKEKGDAYLAENKAKEGVKTTDTGLQYEVIKAGTGKKPSAEDRVVVHYRGTLIDGTQFDSSYDREQPAEFGVTQVILGWQEALKMMPVGSKWKLTVPSELAYGASERPGIPANSVLVFDVELLEIKDQEKNAG